MAPCVDIVLERTTCGCVLLDNAAGRAVRSDVTPFRLREKKLIRNVR
jgi:hypothetical protein